MNNFFNFCKTIRVQRQQYKLNLEISKSNQASRGTKSLRIQDPMALNSLLFHIDSLGNVQAFKEVIEFCDGSKCSYIIFYVFVFVLNICTNQLVLLFFHLSI